MGRNGSRPRGPAPRSGLPSPARLRRTNLALVLAVFVVALAVRGGIFSTDHSEGDERLYLALVEQLDAGRGYTLQGHPILDEPWVVRSQYDRPLFYHPPGGPGLFWWFHKLAGDRGFALAQLFSFTVFFWSTVGLGRLVLGGGSLASSFVLSTLAGFTPVVAHVHTHYWLDGPQVAFATAAAALFVLAVRRGRVGWAVPAGWMLAWACLVKLNALLVVPGLVALAWTVMPERENDRWRRLVAPLLVMLAVVGIAVAPWLVVQWRELGALFPSWAGKPDPELVRSNPYIRFVTEVRGPWSYLRMLPQAVATLVPSLLLLAWARTSPRVRRIGMALVFWIASVVVVHVALGYVGYSKLLRYVILLTPAAIVLCTLTIQEALERMRTRARMPRPDGAPASDPWVRGLLALAMLGLALEVSLGAMYVLRHPTRDLILMWPDRAMMQEMVDGSR